MTSQQLWKPCWTRGGEIEDIIWIGKDVLAWCNGLCIVFFNIVQKSQELRWCASSSAGDGAKCLAGHPKLPIFAFSEKILNPRILICSYPSMTNIAECAHGSESGYFAIAFTAQQYVISLGQYPEFSMIIWCWKTGEKMTVINTSIYDDAGQILRVTQSGPIAIAQMGRSSGQLHTWELTIIKKNIILTDHEISLPDDRLVYWIDWCPTSNEPLLAITDKDGHIFLSNVDGSNVPRIVISQRCGVCLNVERPIVSWFRDGIVLRTTFCQVRFFRKKPNKTIWSVEWYIKSEIRPNILVTNPIRSDCFFYYTLEGYLMRVDFSENKTAPSVKNFLDHGSYYRSINFVYPWCHHLVAIQDSKVLIFFERYSGVVVAKLDLEIDGDVSGQASHPDYPLIIMGSILGELIIVSMANPKKPELSLQLRLQKGPLDLIRISYCGKYAVAAEKKSGKCYIINLNQNGAPTVQALVQVDKEIVDGIIFTGRRLLKLGVLQVGSASFSVGQQLIIYNILESTNFVTQISEIFNLPGVYRTLWPVPGNPHFLIGCPFLTRQLRVQKLQDFKNLILVNSVTTGHQVRMANIFADRQWITSTAIDGIAFVRDKTVNRVGGNFPAHHKQDLGTLKAVVTCEGDMAVCLGFNGSIIAMKNEDSDQGDRPVDPPPSEIVNLHRVDYTWHERQRQKILADYSSLESNVGNMLRELRDGYPLAGSEAETWEEWRATMQIKEETEQSFHERMAILKDFDLLKARVKELLDVNDNCPKIERLPVASFDLDTLGREQKLKVAKDERDDTRKRLEHNSAEMRRVSNWIRTTYWDRQVVLSKSLFEIFASKVVSNYPLTSEDSLFKDKLIWADFCKDTTRKIMGNDIFQPWHRYTTRELAEKLDEAATLHLADDSRTMDILWEEEEAEIDPRELEEERAALGMTTYRFVEQSPHHYTQMELYGFAQTKLNNLFLEYDSSKLRNFFNDAFEEVYKLKQREMRIVEERIEKIRKIDSELNIMFRLRVPKVPIVPEWKPEEEPESIITVLDREVAAKPYISPSQQDLLDKQAAEEERLRLLMLADNFHERALMAMMDGVLEIRWEDIIKIDIPKPRCMLEKKPEDFTAEDVLAVKRYEKDVQHLLEERERYKRILETDYVKISNLLQDGVDRFNAKLDELFRLKINVEAALNQLDLHHVRGCLRDYWRIRTLKDEETIIEKMKKLEECLKFLQAQLPVLQNFRKEVVTEFEALSNREKTLAKKFRSDFATIGKANIVLLERHYRRRPKTNLKNLTASDLLDLSSTITSQSHRKYLPVGSIDYLKHLDSYDVRSTIPINLDSQIFEQFILSRRQKIEFELKLLAKQLEIQEIEASINYIFDRITYCKSQVRILDLTLQDQRLHRIHTEQNNEIQLVLKMGQLEIKLRGNLTDTQYALYISRKEVDDINKVILRAGNQKLDIVKQSIKSNRGAQIKEWKQKCLRKKMEYLTDDLRVTSNVTVTKEIQQYLKRYSRGLKDETTPEQLDREVEAHKARCSRLVAKQLARLQEIHREIAATRRKNEVLDRQIVHMNVARCDMELHRDLIGEERQRDHDERKMRMLTARSNLIKRLQDNYAELLALEIQHELLRLRCYPLLAFRTAR